MLSIVQAYSVSHTMNMLLELLPFFIVFGNSQCKINHVQKNDGCDEVRRQFVHDLFNVSLCSDFSLDAEFLFTIRILNLGEEIDHYSRHVNKFTIKFRLLEQTSSDELRGELVNS